VILAGAVNSLGYAANGRSLFTPRHLWAIAAAGVLPDILWPHLSLQARLTSWSHTVWFLAIALPLFVWIGRKYLGPGWRVASWSAWLATVLHLATDTFTGGTAPFYPLGGKVGFSTIPFRYWIYCDLATVPVALGLILHLRSRSGEGVTAKGAKGFSGVP
jgi:hypothetical protein